MNVDLIFHGNSISPLNEVCAEFPDHPECPHSFINVMTFFLVLIVIFSIYQIVLFIRKTIERKSLVNRLDLLFFSVTTVAFSFLLLHMRYLPYLFHKTKNTIYSILHTVRCRNSTHYASQSLYLTIYIVVIYQTIQVLSFTGTIPYVKTLKMVLLFLSLVVFACLFYSYISFLNPYELMPENNLDEIIIMIFQAIAVGFYIFITSIAFVFDVTSHWFYASLTKTTLKIFQFLLAFFVFISIVLHGFCSTPIEYEYNFDSFSIYAAHHYESSRKAYIVSIFGSDGLFWVLHIICIVIMMWMVRRFESADDSEFTDPANNVLVQSLISPKNSTLRV